MKQSYETQLLVRSFDTDPLGYFKPSSMLKYMQEIAGKHMYMDFPGTSYFTLRQEGLVFIITHASVQILEPVPVNRAVVLKTWCRRTKGVRYLRNYTYTDAETGRVLIEARTVWVMIDPESRRILRPTAFRYPVEFLEKDFSWKEENGLVLPYNMKQGGVFTVRYSDTDYNEHLNNTRYADLMCDYTLEPPIGVTVSGFDIQFCSEAVMGDEIRILTGGDGGVRFVSGEGNKGTCFKAGFTVTPTEFYREK